MRKSNKKKMKILTMRVMIQIIREERMFGPTLAKMDLRKTTKSVVFTLTTMQVSIKKVLLFVLEENESFKSH